MKDDRAENTYFHHPGLLIKASNKFFLTTALKIMFKNMKCILLIQLC